MGDILNMSNKLKQVTAKEAKDILMREGGGVLCINTGETMRFDSLEMYDLESVDVRRAYVLLRNDENTFFVQSDETV